jgi:hypothetical protein
MNMMSSRTAALTTTPTIGGGGVIKANKCNICMDIVVDDVELKVRVIGGMERRFVLKMNIYLFRVSILLINFLFYSNIN